MPLFLGDNSRGIFFLKPANLSRFGTPTFSLAPYLLCLMSHSGWRDRVKQDGFLLQLALLHFHPPRQPSPKDNRREKLHAPLHTHHLSRDSYTPSSLSRSLPLITQYFQSGSKLKIVVLPSLVFVIQSFSLSTLTPSLSLLNQVWHRSASAIPLL